MNIDPKIRYVTIVDIDERLMAGGQRNGITNHVLMNKANQLDMRLKH
jgi:hypothetical protein